MNANYSDVTWPGYVVLESPPYAQPSYELASIYTVPDASASDEGGGVATYDPLDPAHSMPCVDAPILECQRRFSGSEELAQACVVGVHLAHGASQGALSKTRGVEAAARHGHELAKKCLAQGA